MPDLTDLPHPGQLLSKPSANEKLWKEVQWYLMVFGEIERLFNAHKISTRLTPGRHMKDGW